MDTSPHANVLPCAHLTPAPDRKATFAAGKRACAVGYEFCSFSRASRFVFLAAFVSALHTLTPVEATSSDHPLWSNQFVPP